MANRKLKMENNHISNSDIAKLFRNVAAAYAIKDEAKHRFQIIAYQKAAEILENTTLDVKQLLKENRLNELPGIGTSIQGHIKELLTRGKSDYFQGVLKDIPSAVFPLLDIPGFGPKKSFKLVTHFALKNPDRVINELESLAREGKIASLAGFGEKSEQDILRAITAYKQGQSKTVRMGFPYANSLANSLLTYLRSSRDVLEAYPLGSLRRKRETIGDIDIAVSTNDPDAVIEHFIAYPHKERILERGDTTAGIITNDGKHVDLMTMAPESFGSLLQHFTGSKNHNIHLREYAQKKGLSLSEYGIKHQKNGKWKMETFKTEEDFYHFLDMQWIPPEIREDSGEIELAIENKLPSLVKNTDIKGDFHLHSSFPIEPSHDMGANSMEEMVNKAIQLKYAYIGFAEHNPSQSKHTAGQTKNILEKRLKEIERLRLKYKNIIRIFSLLEVDILPNGDLAISESNVQYLDFMLVSVHSVFNMDKDAMTQRVLKALEHPKAKILTHPTGRLINKRQGYELDWPKIFKYCHDNRKALEINAYPDRLDLPDLLIREAKINGIKFTIDTDSHALEQMEMMEYGVANARRGWATRDDILNTMEYNEIRKWFNL